MRLKIKSALALSAISLLSVFVSFQAMSLVYESELPAIDCFIDAYSDEGLFLTENAASILCSGATSPTAPIDCFMWAVSPYDLILFDEAAVELCSGAVGVEGPLDCFLELANSSDFQISEENAVRLCSP